MKETIFQVLDRETFDPIGYDILDEQGWSINWQWWIRRQYTTCVDKYGTRIYDWDIVNVSRQCAFEYQNYISRWVVKFWDHMVWFDSDMAVTWPALWWYIEAIDEWISRYDTDQWESMIWEYVSMDCSNSQMEVIWNIYKNPLPVNEE